MNTVEHATRIKRICAENFAQRAANFAASQTSKGQIYYVANWTSNNLATSHVSRAMSYTLCNHARLKRSFIGVLFTMAGKCVTCPCCLLSSEIVERDKLFSSGRLAINKSPGHANQINWTLGWGGRGGGDPLWPSVSHTHTLCTSADAVGRHRTCAVWGANILCRDKPNYRQNTSSYSSLCVLFWCVCVCVCGTSHLSNVPTKVQYAQGRAKLVATPLLSLSLSFPLPFLNLVPIHVPYASFMVLKVIRFSLRFNASKISVRPINLARV